MSSSKIYVVVADDCCSYADQPIQVIESIRICYGLNGINQYQKYVDSVNKTRNYQHEVYSKEITEVVENPQWLAVGMTGTTDYSCPDLDSARFFEDMDSAIEYIMSLFSGDYKHGKIIPIDELSWEYDTNSMGKFPKMIESERMMTAPVCKSKKGGKKGK